MSSVINANYRPLDWKHDVRSKLRSRPTTDFNWYHGPLCWLHYAQPVLGRTQSLWWPVQQSTSGLSAGDCISSNLCGLQPSMTMLHCLHCYHSLGTRFVSNVSSCIFLRKLNVLHGLQLPSAVFNSTALSFLENCTFFSIQTTGNINSNNWLARNVHKMTEHV